jgi:hypothetical protein
MAGPGKSRKREHRNKPTSGGAWKDSLEEVLMEEATKRAQAHVEAQDQDSDDDVVMRIPVTIFMSFPRKGKELAGDPGVDCACTIFQDEDGSEVCICYGTCPDDACDDGPIFTKG